MSAQHDEQDPVELHLPELTQFEVVTRSDWGAREPERAAPPLRHPVPQLHLSYVPVNPVTKTPEIMRDLQSDDIESGMTDVRANFLIAGDGSVYEGRGWHVEPDYIDEFADEMGKFLEICFLGDYDKADTSHPIYLGLIRLLSFGINENFITEDATFLGMDEMPPLNEMIKPPVYI